MLDLAMAECARQNAEYNEMLDKKNAKLDSIWRNPWFVGPVAAAAGTILGLVLAR